jgi:hypothetical protein
MPQIQWTSSLCILSISGLSGRIAPRDWVMECVHKQPYICRRPGCSHIARLRCPRSTHVGNHHNNFCHRIIFIAMKALLGARAAVLRLADTRLPNRGRICLGTTVPQYHPLSSTTSGSSIAHYYCKLHISETLSACSSSQTTCEHEHPQYHDVLGSFGVFTRNSLPHYTVIPLSAQMSHQSWFYSATTWRARYSTGEH